MPADVNRRPEVHQDRLSARGAWLVLAATALALMMDGVDATALAVANPVLAQDLAATLPQLEAITVGYMLAMSMALIPAGALADRVGHRRVFLTGLGGFAASSLLVGLSDTATLMAVWRLAQGVSGAMLAASSLALLRHTFTPERLKVAIGLSGSGLALATLAGPFIGGVLVQYLHWRAIFFVNIPIGAVAFALAAAFAPRNTAQRDAGRVDMTGASLATLAVFALVSGITRAQVDGWSGIYPVFALTASAVFLAAFGLRERTATNPLLPPILFQNRRILTALTVILAAGLAHFGTTFYYALYLQQLRGLTPIQAGAGLLPVIGLVALGAPASGFLNRRYGPRLPIVTGLLLLCVGLTGLSVIGVDATFAVVVVFLLPMGLGIGLAQPAAVEVVISAAPPAVAGVASGLQQTVLMISGSLGTAIFGSIISANAPEFAGHAVAAGESTEFLTGFGYAMQLGAAMTLAAAIAAAAALRQAPIDERQG